jgi:hypothetical protein
MKKKISLESIEKWAKVFCWGLVAFSITVFIWGIVTTIQEIHDGFANVFGDILMTVVVGICTFMSTAMTSNWTFGECKTRIGQRIAVKMLKEQ